MGRNNLKIIASCFSLLTFIAGCKKERDAPSQAAPVKEAAAPVQAVTAAVKRDEYVYNPAGKRDPFKPFIEGVEEKRSAVAVKNIPANPLQSYSISELRLVGVIILPDKKVAMIEDPAGRGYTLKVGTLIGMSDGRVVGIIKDEVIIEEMYLDETGGAKRRKASMKIPREEGAITE